MVYRDPETGQYRSDGNGSKLTYADHDVHHIRHEVLFRDTADSGPNDNYADEQQFEITARGIDPDELAELRTLTVRAALVVDDAPEVQDEIGGITADLGCGFNLSGTEFLNAGGASLSSVDNDNSGTADYQIVTKDTDEVGQLWSATLSAYPGFSDTADGTGGAGSMPVVTQTLDLSGMFGTGPFVDSADDFTSRVALNLDNLITGVGVNVQYSLGYRVETMEGGRTRFGR